MIEAESVQEVTGGAMLVHIDTVCTMLRAMRRQLCAGTLECAEIGGSAQYEYEWTEKQYVCSVLHAASNKIGG